MGYSDIGCFGGEIPTPNINSIANSGVKFTQFYNASRSCPTRAGLMTGLYPHQSGIGYMSEEPNTNASGKDIRDWDLPSYKGYLTDNCVTIAEVVKEAGYHTHITGKWHLGMHNESKYPLQRGFDNFYGILTGACSYLRPYGDRGLWLQNEKLAPPEGEYYTTNAFTDYAIKFIDEQPDDDNPFFLYLSYNAPHWPLQAPEEYIEMFYEKYRNEGWDNIRDNRRAKMIELGIIDSDTGFAEWENRLWDELSPDEKDKTAYRMAVYAAQVFSVDQNVGRLIDYLKSKNQYNNTLFFFLSDNGACAEPMEQELGGGKQSDINNPAIYGHPSYGRAWAQTSNTPFRKYKQRAYEGGISTPLIVSWQDGIGNQSGKLYEMAGFVADLMTTIVDVSGAKYPKRYNGADIHPMEGSSLIPVIEGKKSKLHDYIFWEHQGNRAVRWGDWKVVWDEKINEWELYNIAQDRIESQNLASQNPAIVKKLSKKWMEWATENFVLIDFPYNKKQYNTPHKSDHSLSQK